MPSQILHALFGEDLIAALETTLHCRLVEAGCRDAFVLGCQGPDIFYHNQTTRPVGLEYGTLLHRRGYGSFVAALFDLLMPEHAAPSDELAAYTWGFATHAILDRSCHPYIVYKTAKTSGEGRARQEAAGERNIHAFFERILDVLMLEALRGQPVASWDQDCLARICGDPPLGLRELLAEALRGAFPERAGGDAKLRQRMDNVFRDCEGFYHYTGPGTTTFLQGRGTPAEQAAYQRRILEEAPLVYVYPEALPRDVDYLNLEHRVWQYPLAGGERDTRSFPEIYAQALEAGAETLGPLAAEHLAGSFPDSKKIALRIGNGGLSIQDREGKPVAAGLSDPLPLERVLEQQRQARLAAGGRSPRT